MALVLRDAFAGTGMGGWVTTWTEGGGVATPDDYTVDTSAIWDTAHSGSHRMEIELGGSTLKDFALVCCLADSSDLTSNHIRAKFTIGSSVAPSWNDPDTITLTKWVGGTETQIQITNTSSLLLTPATGNIVSLRDERLTATDRVAIMAINDGTDAQVFVFINDTIRVHEKVSGVTVSGKTGIINFDSTGDLGNNTYDNFYNQDITPRFVSKHASADDTNDGSDLTTNAWATIPRGCKQNADEVVLVGAGTYTEKILLYALVDEHGTGLGNPRKPTSRNDGNYVLAMADNVVRPESSNPLRAHSESAYFYFYNMRFRNNIGASQGVSTINLTNSGADVQGPVGFTFQGGGVQDGYWHGMIFSSGASFPDGGHKVIDCLIKGNGNNTQHQLYPQVRDCEISWCDVDGVGDSWNSNFFGIHPFQQTDATKLNNTVVKYNWVHGHLNSGSAGILVARGADIQCYGNRIYNNYNGLSVGFTAVDPVVHNNLIYENTNDGITVGSTTAPLIYNNTVASNTGEGIGGDTTSTNAGITNNLAWNNAGGNIVDPGASGWTELTNLEPTIDPFVDSANDDYSIGSGSAAKNGGTDLSATIDAIDILGFLRPQNTTWSRGAYEFPNPTIFTAPVLDVVAEKAVKTDTETDIMVGASDVDNDIVSGYAWVQEGTISVTTTGTVS